MKIMGALKWSGRLHQAWIRCLFLAWFFSGILGEATQLRYGPNTSAADLDVRIKKYSMEDLSPGRFGDINGDGFEDFAVGDWRADGPRPATVGIFFGRRDWPHDLNLSHADLLIHHEAIGDYLGYTYSLHSGDFDGDGFDDLVLSDGWATGGGRVFLTYGKPDFPTGEIRVDQLANISIREGSVGNRIQFCGDFNGDGIDDLALWECCATDEIPGRFYIVPGSARRYSTWEEMKAASWVFGIGTGTEWFGNDWTEDGLDDIGFSRSGTISCVLFGRSAPLPWYVNAANEAPKEDSYARCFWALPSGGGGRLPLALDINDDNFGEFFLGERNSEFGKIYILKGGENLNHGEIDNNLTYSIRGESTRDKFGDPLTYAGDVDSDGFEDFLGAAYAAGPGKVYGFLGGPRKWNGKNIPASRAEFSVTGEYGLFGSWIANVGDVNGDAIDDWCFGGLEKAYLVFPALNTRPFPIRAIRPYADKNYTLPATQPCKIWERLYIEVEAEDRDPSTRNVCEVTLGSAGYPRPGGFKLRCKESGDNTGLFRGNVLLSDTGVNRFWRRMRVLRTDTVTITSWEDRNITATASIADVTATPLPSFTPTPTATPTPTPRPENILLAGYWDTSLIAEEGGDIWFEALLGHMDPTLNIWNCYRLYIAYEGQRSHEYLSVWNDYTAHYHLALPGGIPRGRFLLELELEGLCPENDLLQAWWPYFTVGP